MDSDDNQSISIQSEIESLLAEEPKNELLRNEVHKIKPGDPDGAARMLSLFIQMHFENDEAVYHWSRILQNHADLKKRLTRPVSLRTAIFDYFISLTSIISCPLVVEMRVFRQTQEQAMLDQLTGLYNRRFFDQAIAREIKRAERYHTQFSVLFLDLDNFKKINDQFGHPAGDEILRLVANVLQKNARLEDTVCRFGGEEFVILLPETTGSGAVNYAERLRTNLAQEKSSGGLKVTVSGGIACFPQDGKTAENLLLESDKALYAAKFAGKDCIIHGTSDKRRFERYTHPCRVKFNTVEQVFAKEAREIITQDFSIGGIRVESPELFAIETKLLLSIQLPGQETLETLGKISWIKKNGSGYQYGVKYLDLDHEKTGKLQKAVQSLKI